MSIGASLVAQLVKNLPAMQETQVQFLGREDPLEKDSKESTCNVGDLADPWVGTTPWRRAWQPTPVFLPGESPWTEEPGGSMGSQRVGHD